MVPMNPLSSVSMSKKKKKLDYFKNTQCKFFKITSGKQCFFKMCKDYETEPTFNSRCPSTKASPMFTVLQFHDGQEGGTLTATP